MNVFDRLVSVPFTWRDAVDVLVVAFIIYNILALIRGTRAMQVSIGMMLLGSTFFIARVFDLPALESISREILFYLPFAVIVLFQAEIRRGLARMGTNPLVAIFGRKRSQVPYEEIVEAAGLLAARHVGALIAIEGSQTLRSFEENAKPVDALATTELLVAIFTPGGPLHDGAVIIRGGRVAFAGAFLPLSTSVDPKLTHGTRHRAAVGATEESDALIVVVSEENGSIAVVSDGELRENLTRDMLHRALVERFGAHA